MVQTTVALVLEFVTPISVFGSYNGISAFSSIVVGTLIGTYLANFVIKSSKVIEEHGETIGNVMGDALDKGKDYIDNLKSEESIEDQKSEEVPLPKATIKPIETTNSRRGKNVCVYTKPFGLSAAICSSLLLTILLSAL